jgi:hypothetical protein
MTRTTTCSAPLLVAVLLLGAAGCAARTAPSSGDAAPTAEPGVITSVEMARDVALTASPAAPHWTDVRAAILDRDYLGVPILGRPTEVRSRWTRTHLYLLYACPYDNLYLKPSPDVSAETPKLWNWDVAEAFIGWDTTNIARYREFQVSPQGEWVDLDINRADASAQKGMAWNSGFEVMARVDEAARVWYGEMKIPFAAIDPRAPEPGRTLRAGLYRIAGPDPRTFYAWQPTGLLFSVPPSHPAPFVIVTLVTLGAALVASWIPARRAAAADALGLMRGE